MKFTILAGPIFRAITTKSTINLNFVQKCSMKSLHEIPIQFDQIISWLNEIFLEICYACQQLSLTECSFRSFSESYGLNCLDQFGFGRTPISQKIDSKFIMGNLKTIDFRKSPNKIGWFLQIYFASCIHFYNIFFFVWLEIFPVDFLNVGNGKNKYILHKKMNLLKGG